MSPTCTASAPLAAVLISLDVQVGLSAKVAVFSHQVMSSPILATAKTSISPSESTSSACTCLAPSKLPSIVYSVQPPSEGVPSFSHQVTSSAPLAELTTSISPSKSISTT